MAATTASPPLPAHELSYQHNELPKLRSNHGPYLDDSTVGWMKPTPVTTPMAEMRRRFDEDGYIWCQNVMPREDVLDMREAYFAHLAPTGILKPGTSPREGIFDEREDPIAHNGVGGRDLPEARERVEKLVGAHTMDSYLNFLEHEGLRGFVREFMGWEKDVLIKRTMLRQESPTQERSKGLRANRENSHNVPNGLSTGIHYDKIFLRAGEADFLTAWVPIGDCDARGGGLMYLEHSDDIGRDMEADFNERAKDFTDAERINGFNKNMARDGQLSHNVDELTKELEASEFGAKGRRRRWMVGDFKAGDVVFHNPYLIHGAVKNEDPQGRIRLSTDLRFYEEGSKLDERWMRSVWRPDDGL